MLDKLQQKQTGITHAGPVPKEAAGETPPAPAEIVTEGAIGQPEISQPLATPPPVPATVTDRKDPPAASAAPARAKLRAAGPVAAKRACQTTEPATGIN